MYISQNLDSIETNKVYWIGVLCIVYQTLSVACDPLDFRLVKLFGVVFTGSALIFPILYVLLDATTRIAGKSLAIKLSIIFELSDGLFTYLINGINQLPAPLDFKLLPAYTAVFSPMCRLYLSGILGSVVAGIADVIIYSFIQKKFKSFFMASTISTLLIILIHNIPTDYITFHKEFPDKYIYLIIFNYTVCACVAVISSAVTNYILPKHKFQVKRKNEFFT